MDIIDRMNYRFDNPVDVPVDSKIAERFSSRERTKEQIEMFNEWISLSKENVMPLTINYELERQTGIVK